MVILRQKCTAGIMDILDNPTPEAKKTFIHSGILLFICWLLAFIGLQTKEKKILYWSMNQSVGHSELKTESPVFPSTLFYIFLRPYPRIIYVSRCGDFATQIHKYISRMNIERAG